MHKTKLFLILFACTMYSLGLQAGIDANSITSIPKSESMKAGEDLAHSIQAYQQFRAEKKDMSRKERKATRKEVKKNYKTALRNFKNSSDIDLGILILITILLPPLGMYLFEGEINDRFWISLLLTLLFYLPGLIYTLVIILS